MQHNKTLLCRFNYSTVFNPSLYLNVIISIVIRHICLLLLHLGDCSALDTRWLKKLWHWSEIFLMIACLSTEIRQFANFF